MAAKILKCGLSKVWIDPASEKVKKAVTRKDIRNLIKEGLIAAKSKKQKHAAAKKEKRRGFGSRKGSAAARAGKKQAWLKIIRPQRLLLKQIRAKKSIDAKTYKKIYLMVKGGSFRSKKHLLMYLREHGLIKQESA